MNGNSASFDSRLDQNSLTAGYPILAAKEETVSKIIHHNLAIVCQLAPREEQYYICLLQPILEKKTPMPENFPEPENIAMVMGSILSHKLVLRSDSKYTQPQMSNRAAFIFLSWSVFLFLAFPLPSAMIDSISF